MTEKVTTCISQNHSGSEVAEGRLKLQTAS